MRPRSPLRAPSTVSLTAAWSAMPMNRIWNIPTLRMFLSSVSIFPSRSLEMMWSSRLWFLMTPITSAFRRFLSSGDSSSSRCHLLIRLSA